MYLFHDTYSPRGPSGTVVAAAAAAAAAGVAAAGGDAAGASPPVPASPSSRSVMCIQYVYVHMVCTSNMYIQHVILPPAFSLR